MILDVLENAHRYYCLNKNFKKAFEFLSTVDLNKRPTGKYEIDKDRVYAIVAKEQGRKKEHALLETHQQYIDIQLVLDGCENMGWKPNSACKQSNGEYEQSKDLQFFKEHPDVWLSVNKGNFAIFFPEDAHMPLISSEIIHKVIVKVAIN